MKIVAVTSRGLESRDLESLTMLLRTVPGRHFSYVLGVSALRFALFEALQRKGVSNRSTPGSPATTIDWLALVRPYLPGVKDASRTLA